MGEYFRNIIDERLSFQERKPVVYTYQKELAIYLHSQDSQFRLKQSDRRTSECFKTGMEFLDCVLNKPEYKSKTRLLAVYLWHSLFSITDQKFTDQDLFHLLPCCVWIATKHEEYYMTGSKLIISWFNSHFSRSSCAKFGVKMISKSDLLEREMSLLSVIDFKVITPSILNLITLLRAEVLNENSNKFDTAAIKVLEEAYSLPTIFTFPASELAMACLAVACSNLDETRIWQRAQIHLSSSSSGTEPQLHPGSREGSTRKIAISRDKSGIMSEGRSGKPKTFSTSGTQQPPIIPIDLKLVQKLIQMLTEVSEKKKKDKARLVLENHLPRGVQMEKTKSQSQRNL